MTDRTEQKKVGKDETYRDKTQSKKDLTRQRDTMRQKEVMRQERRKKDEKDATRLKKTNKKDIRQKDTS